ncbi:12631_t:CDS:2 [Racocetra persica]|uniref:12631_t:CDS:1 n=1 Tax=Racocetra persica TaxID=160502 RepID=A0ACA9LGD5_9GLOM|nr:12631_t:CDS:2 [Racocetra persica]
MKTNHTLTSDNSPLVKSLEKENAKRRRNSENRIKSLFVVQKDNSQACLLATINNPFKELNKQQKSAQELVLAGKSIFLTGAAGTGKSFLLKHLIRLLQEKYSGEQIGITSTTGTGAIIIGGNTIHSYLGIGVIGHLPAKISMLEGELFTKLETLAGIIRKNPEPFGGIQLILEVGNLNTKELAQLPGSAYFFAAKDEEKFPGQSIELARSCLAVENQGVVMDFVSEAQAFYPVVKFTDGQRLVVKEHVWEKITSYDTKNKPIVSARRTQIPLILA